MIPDALPVRDLLRVDHPHALLGRRLFLGDVVCKERARLPLAHKGPLRCLQSARRDRLGRCPWHRLMSHGGIIPNAGGIVVNVFCGAIGARFPRLLRRQDGRSLRSFSPPEIPEMQVEPQDGRCRDGDLIDPQLVNVRQRK